MLNFKLIFISTLILTSYSVSANAITAYYSHCMKTIKERPSKRADLCGCVDRNFQWSRTSPQQISNLIRFREAYPDYPKGIPKGEEIISPRLNEDMGWEFELIEACDRNHAFDVRKNKRQ